MDSLRTVLFPDAGEGVFLRFRNRDLRDLFNDPDFGPNYVQVATEGIIRFDLNIIDKLLKAGAKKGDAEFKVSLDDLDGVSLEEVQRALLDALSLSVNGRKYLEQIEYVDAEIRRRQKAGDPEGPTTPSP